jgi:hypothetical protein
VNGSVSNYWDATDDDFEFTNGAVFYIGVRRVGESSFTQFGSVERTAYWARMDNSYFYDHETASISTVISGLEPGDYEVGLVGSVINDYLMPAGYNLTVLKSN